MYYIFRADIYYCPENYKEDNYLHNHTISKYFHFSSNAKIFVANQLFKALEKRLNKDLTNLKDPKLYESEYIHDFKIMGHIKNNLTIMDELKKLYLQGETVEYNINYDIVRVEVEDNV